MSRSLTRTCGQSLCPLPSVPLSGSGHPQMVSFFPVYPPTSTVLARTPRSKVCGDEGIPSSGKSRNRRVCKGGSQSLQEWTTLATQDIGNGLLLRNHDPTVPDSTRPTESPMTTETLQTQYLLCDHSTRSNPKVKDPEGVRMDPRVGDMKFRRVATLSCHWRV